MLFCLRKLKVSIFEGTLIGSEASVSRRESWCELLWEIIELQLVISHSIHKLPFLRVRNLRPYEFFFACFAIYDEAGFIPSPFDFILYLSWGREYLSSEAVVITARPSSFKKFEFHVLFVWALEVSHISLTPSIQVG
jgi:hypothetical protein